MILKFFHILFIAIKSLWSFMLFHVCVFVVFLYRMLGSRENIILLQRRVIHKIERTYTKTTFYLKFLISKGKPFIQPRDEDLGMFLCDLVSVVENWWEERVKYMEPYIEFEEWMIGKIFGKDIVNVMYTGSHRESIVSMHYSETSSDIDMMYVYKDFCVSEADNCEQSHFKIVNSETPGYIYLEGNCSRYTIINQYKTIAEKGEFFKSIKVPMLIKYFFDEVFYELDTRAAIDENNILTSSNILKTNSYYIRSDKFRYMHELFVRERFTGWMQFQQRGPASTVVWNVAGLPKRQMIGEIDIVFCFHSRKWPKQAMEWLTRKRYFSFPSKETISAIKSYGVDIVPKGNLSYNAHSTQNTPSQCVCDNLKWRLSFSAAELILVKSWTKMQKIFYRFIKTLRSDYFSKYDVTSYILKNIMFYFVEETSEKEWVENNFISLLKIFLGKLLVCCRNNYCKHYFIKRQNLLQNKDSSKLMAVAELCKNIIENIYKTVLLSDGLWFNIKKFRFVDYWNYLTNDVKKLKKRHQFEQDLQDTQAKVHEASVRVYYSQKVHREAMKFLIKSLSSPNMSSSIILQSLLSYIKNKLTDNYNENEILTKGDEKMESKKFEIMSKEERIIFIQICWATIKCLRYIDELKINDSMHSNSIKLQSVLLNIFSKDEISQPVVAAEMFLKGRYLDCLKILNNVNFENGVDELLNAKIAPLVLCILDLNIVNQMKDFEFGEAVYYFPLTLFKVFVILKIRNEINKKEGQVIDIVVPSKSELIIMLEKVATLWNEFPHINVHINARLYETVFISLSKYTHRIMQIEVLKLER